LAVSATTRSASASVERDRLLDQHGLAALERLHQRLDVLAFARRDDHGAHFRPRDRGEVVAGVELRADCLRRVARSPLDRRPRWR